MTGQSNAFVYVGKKPLMSYVLASVMQINTKGREVIIKARGQAISRAVDVAEVVRRKFVPNAVIKDIRIATESLTREDGSPSNVSSIEIVLYRGEDKGPVAKLAGPAPPKA